MAKTNTLALKEQLPGIKIIRVQITGMTPLLCNAFTDEAAMAATKGSSISMKGEKGSPQEQADKKLYRGVDGHTLIIPGPNVFSCIIAAGTFFKNGKSKVTTQKSSLIPACVAISEIEIPIKFGDKWAVDTRAVRNPSTGGRFLCYRPIFNDWQLEFTLELDNEFMPEKQLREIVDAAGKRIGLGDFRPACKGPFGRFVVTKWEPLN